MEDNSSDDFGKKFLIFTGIGLLLLIPLLFLTGNGTAAVILIVVMGFVSVVVGSVLLHSSTHQNKEEDEEDLEPPQHRQYDENRYANQYMKKIYEAYNIKEDTLDETDDEVSTEEEELDYQEEKTISINQPTPNALTFSYETEADENRRNLFRKISLSLGVISVLLFFTITSLPSVFEEMKTFLESGTINSLFVRISPVLIFIVSRIFEIFGIEPDAEGIRTSKIIRQIFLISICAFYLFNEVSKFMANPK